MKEEEEEEEKVVVEEEERGVLEEVGMGSILPTHCMAIFCLHKRFLWKGVREVEKPRQEEQHEHREREGKHRRITIMQTERREGGKYSVEGREGGRWEEDVSPT
eukprot:760167-Hanusia_phi.AAC.4